MRSLSVLLLLLALSGTIPYLASAFSPKAKQPSRTSSSSSFASIRKPHRHHPFVWLEWAHDNASGGQPQRKTVLRLVPPDHADSIVHASNFASVINTQWLADAAADAVRTTAQNEGWWKAYLSLFKAALSNIHSTIDPPLRARGFTQTWGLSIFLFTAGFRSLLVPLSVQQTKGAEYMKALKPYMEEIKEKFKDNEDARNRALGKLYEDANQNPLSGCLFSLLQLPILLGLYRGIRLLAQEGKLEEPFLFIPSLEGPVTPPDYRGMDWLTSGWTPGVDGGLPIPPLGWETTLAFLVMPVVLVLGQSLTMSVLNTNMETPTMTEEEKQNYERSQTFLKFLPLMIGYFSLQVPAGLTIYWFTSNLFTLIQSVSVKAYYNANPPEIELPDYWDALENLDDLDPEAKRKAAKAGIATGPTMQDLIQEANFHYVVQRYPLREKSPSWEELDVSQMKVLIPEPLQEWVDAAPSVVVGQHQPTPPDDETQEHTAEDSTVSHAVGMPATTTASAAEVEAAP